MDEIEKSFKSLNPKEQRLVKEILHKLATNSLGGLDVKKLQGTDNIFRIRKGIFRIIYQKIGNRNILIRLQRRSEKTYKGF